LSKKQGCEWIVVSHDPIEVEPSWSVILDSIANNEKTSDGGDQIQGIITLKFEPFILHVQCKDLEAGKKLHVQRFTISEILEQALLGFYNFDVLQY